MLGSLKEWHAIENIPQNVIPISMTGDWQKDEYVILMIASNKRKEVTPDALWTRDFVSGIQNEFRISLVGNGHKHHGSYGNYFGWGITAKYDIDHCISYGKFATKQGFDDKLHKEYCTILQSDITFAAIELNSHLPWIVQCGQQVIQSLVNISNNKCLPSGKMTSFQEGMVSGYICQNACTLQPHTEKDCSYTLIISPLCHSGLNDLVGYVFELQWNGPEEQINILLNQGTYIYFLGYGITHRQVHLDNHTGNAVNHDFWNISSYANKHLFDNVMKSLRRCVKM